MRCLSRLVIIPSDPIEEYERKGLDWLDRYYNPQGLFDEVFALSPKEGADRDAHGLKIRRVTIPSFGRVLREIRPDAVRAYGGFWPADLACSFRQAGIPVIVSVHDTNPSLFHPSVCFADHVLCVSRAVADLAISAGVSPGIIRILPNRVDLKTFRPTANPEPRHPELERLPDGRRILHIGRKARQKNLDTVIRALAKLPDDYACVFIGQGPTLGFKELARQLGVDERCAWIESVTNSELPLWYSWCDCFCVPSRWEGFGLVFLEAAACGAPIVTSDLAPMNELLTHGCHAHLVPEYEDPEAIARAIRTVCEDDFYRRQLSRNAPQAAIPFDREVVDALEAAFYREVVARGPRARRRVERFAGRLFSFSYRARAGLNAVRARVRLRSRLRESWEGLTPRRRMLAYRVLGLKVDRGQWHGDETERWETYRRLMRMSWEETRDEAPQYFARLSFSVSHVTGRVFELGCGIGTMTRWLVASPKVAEVVAADSSREALAELEQCELPRVRTSLISSGGLGLDTDSMFDTFVACEVLEHMYPDEERALLKSLRPHVSPKTAYVISVPIGWLPDPHHVRSFSRSAFLKHLAAYYGKPLKIDSSSGYSQVAWGYFDCRWGALSKSGARGC